MGVEREVGEKEVTVHEILSELSIATRGAHSYYYIDGIPLACEKISSWHKAEMEKAINSNLDKADIILQAKKKGFDEGVISEREMILPIRSAFKQLRGIVKIYDIEAIPNGKMAYMIMIIKEIDAYLSGNKLLNEQEDKPK